MLRPCLAFAIGAAVCLAPAVTLADGPAPSAENIKAAGQHFQRARDMYQAGAYRDAVHELEVAIVLDPTAKDLVYNLGVVSEKLGRIDDAIKYFRRYVDMDVDSSERAHAEGFIKRLEGARKEVVQAKTEDDVAPKTPDVKPPPAQSHVARTTLNVVLVSGTVIAVAGLGVGSYFGFKALGDKPASNTITSESQPYSALANAAQNAHNEAIVADVALGVGVVAAVTTFFLYVATRPRAPIYLSKLGAPARPALVPLVASSAGGVVLSGSF